MSNQANKINYRKKDNIWILKVLLIEELPKEIPSSGREGCKKGLYR